MKRNKIVLLPQDETLSEQLAALGGELRCDITSVASSDQLIDMVLQQLPHLIILESREGDTSTFDLCRRIRLCAESFIPLIIMSYSPSADEKKEAFNSGADDYITRPLDLPVTGARIRALLRLKNALDNLRDSQGELQKVSERFARLAAEDGLTGLFNHRHMLELLGREIQRSKRYNQPLSCIMLDLDGFAHINDLHGHIAGDAALKKVAAILADSSRETDLVCRYGGDEFLIISPHTEIHQAAELAERLRTNLKHKRFHPNGPSLHITASFGVTTATKESSIAELIGQADRALYHAKKTGGDAICLWPQIAVSERKRK